MKKAKACPLKAWMQTFQEYPFFSWTIIKNLAVFTASENSASVDTVRKPLDLLGTEEITWNGP